MSQYISMHNMLKEMDTGTVFSFSYVTYDRNRKKGGELRAFPEAKLTRPKNVDLPASTGKADQKAFEKKKFSPNHTQHFTRNFVQMCEGVETALIKKFHPPLVITFNGKKVLA